MTIKPVSAPSSKRVNSTSTANDVDGNKKETHGVPVGVGQVVVVEPSVVVGQAHRNVVIDAHGHGQSPQRRGEVYDEITRTHRCSPHKNTRSKRRDHHDHHHHHKRERVEREKHALSNVTNVVTAATVTAAGVSTNNNSAANVGIGGQSPEHLVLGCQSNAIVPSQTTAGLVKAIEETFSGYNSGDEHLQPKEGAISVEEWQRRDEQFAKCMNERGYELKPVEEDGACLFRSISLQIYGDEGMHDVIRQHTMDYIYKNREYFSQFVTEDINSYIKRKRRKDSHGNHIEIQAISEIYSRPVEVYCYETTPINIFNSEQSKNGYPPLRLSYQRGSHYNAIIDPYNATVGVGLGLAGYKPEFQTKEAVRLSEQLEIEQTMFEDKLKTTDWEATNEAIEEQIARESYLQWCRENLQRSRASTVASSTSATITSSEAARSDSEASPSKYSQLMQLSGDGSSSSSAAAGSANVSLNSSTSALNAIGSPKSNLFEQAFAQLTSKSMGYNLKKDELGYESDATDMSSTSSAGQYGGMSPNTAAAQRAKKAKNRRGTTRGNKKRRHERDTANESPDNRNVDTTDVPAVKSPKHNENSDATTANEQRTDTLEIEQKPCTSKQSNTPEKNVNTESSSLYAASESPKKNATNQTYSNFYQELLEASYATDGFSESEMLQRAIQMSTQDYIEDQKRKYFYGP